MQSAQISVGAGQRFAYIFAPKVLSVLIFLVGPKLKKNSGRTF